MRFKNTLSRVAITLCLCLLTTRETTIICLLTTEFLKFSGRLQRVTMRSKGHTPVGFAQHDERRSWRGRKTNGRCPITPFIFSRI